MTERVSFTELSIPEKLTKLNVNSFKRKIYAHYKKHGRNFPWRPPALKLRKDKSAQYPYYVLVSEIMLQQTQTDRVVPKYKEFIKTFPNFHSLAKASLRDILKVWQGLGYNRRAKSLKKLAEIVVKEYKGKLPRTEGELRQLPGVGPYTAGAVCAFAFNTPALFIETNVRAVFIHFFFSKKKKVHDKELLPLIEKSLPADLPDGSQGRQAREWYFALMDYGAMLKKKHTNPARQSAHHITQSKFEGSDRQIRGCILKVLIAKKKLTIRQIVMEVKKEPRRLRKQLKNLEQEGFIVKQKNNYTLK